MLLHVMPIVEGFGEVEAVPILLRRIVQVFHPEHSVNVLKPIRQPRDRMLRNKDLCLENSLRLANGKLWQQYNVNDCGLILFLCDADKDCAKELQILVRKVAESPDLHFQVSVVFAVREYETWFVGAAESLQKYLNLFTPVPDSPEQDGCQKRWIEDRFRGSKYSETLDQPRLTATFDPVVCRRRCPSFDKLCRDVANALNSKSE